MALRLINILVKLALKGIHAIGATKRAANIQPPLGAKSGEKGGGVALFR